MLSNDTAFVPVPLRLPLRRVKPGRLQARANISACISLSDTQSDKHEWHRVFPKDGYLRLLLTLHSGQVFRWRDCGIRQHYVTESSSCVQCREWAGVIGTRLYVLRQVERRPPELPSHVWWRVAGAVSPPARQEGPVNHVVDVDEDGAALGAENHPAEMLADLVVDVDEIAPVATSAKSEASIDDAIDLSNPNVNQDTSIDQAVEIDNSAAHSTPSSPPKPELPLNHVEDTDEAVLYDYLRLFHDTTPLMESFCSSDATFKTTFPHYSGLRTLRTPPVECLFSFICSANNNIKRISTMVTHLSTRYGTLIARHAGHAYHTFPTAEHLAQTSSEAALRAAGFGYRARYIVDTALLLQQLAGESGQTAEELLLSWRSLARKDVVKRLMRFPGVGRKVAGCVALFSLDQLGEIPVDTHVWKIAVRYMPELEQKSLTERVHERVGDFFRDRFGEEFAGIAHNVLFVGELGDFQLRSAVYPGKVKKKTVSKAKTKVKVKAKMEKKAVRAKGKAGVRASGMEKGASGPKKAKRKGTVQGSKTEDAGDICLEGALLRQVERKILEKENMAKAVKKENSSVSVLKKEDMGVKSEAALVSSDGSKFEDMSSFTKKRKVRAGATSRKSPRKSIGEDVDTEDAPDKPV